MVLFDLELYYTDSKIEMIVERFALEMEKS
jgi:hypothetical protein